MHRSWLTGGMELQIYYKYQRWLDRDSWKKYPPYLECSDTVSFNCFSTLHYINNRLAGFLADEEKGKVGWWFWMNEEEDELLALKLVWGSRNTKSCEVGQYFCLLISVVLLNCFYKYLAYIHTKHWYICVSSLTVHYMRLFSAVLSLLSCSFWNLLH